MPGRFTTAGLWQFGQKSAALSLPWSLHLGQRGSLCDRSSLLGMQIPCSLALQRDGESGIREVRTPDQSSGLGGSTPLHPLPLLIALCHTRQQEQWLKSWTLEPDFLNQPLRLTTD